MGPPSRVMLQSYEKERMKIDRIMIRYLVGVNKDLVLIGVILLAASGAFAEATGKIVGKVTDAKTGEGLPGANVIVLGKKLGSATDLDGSFVIINVPVGALILQASMIGFKPSKATIVQVVQGQTTVQDFRLEVQTIEIGETRHIIDPKTLDRDPDQVESSQLKGTIVTAHMEEPIRSDKNLLYCSTFQIVWNALEDEFIKEKIRLEGDPPTVQALNKRLSTKDDLSEKCYVAVAGKLTEELLQKINKSLKDKFGDQAPPEVRETINAVLPQIFAYAYLFKNLQFPVPFELCPDSLWFQTDSLERQRVVAFGFNFQTDAKKQQEMKEQIRVLSVDKDDHVIIQLITKSENDELILAMVEPKKTLFETIEAVEKACNKGRANPPQQRVGGLGIPIIDFNVKHSYPEVCGKRFLNEKWKEWWINKATQWIRFRLNERGAYLKSEARLVVIGAPWSVVFNRPFLIYLKQKGARYPYFAMWVGNTELMVKK